MEPIGCDAANELDIVKAARSQKNQMTARTHDSSKLPEDVRGLFQMLDHVTREHYVEGGVRERHLGQIANNSSIEIGVAAHALHHIATYEFVNLVLEVIVIGSNATSGIKGNGIGSETPFHDMVEDIVLTLVLGIKAPVEPASGCV